MAMDEISKVDKRKICMYQVHNMCITHHGAVLSNSKHFLQHLVGGLRSVNCCLVPVATSVEKKITLSAGPGEGR